VIVYIYDNGGSVSIDTEQLVVVCIYHSGGCVCIDARSRPCSRGCCTGARSYFVESVYEDILQKSIPAQICQLFFTLVIS